MKENIISSASVSTGSCITITRTLKRKLSENNENSNASTACLTGKSIANIIHESKTQIKRNPLRSLDNYETGCTDQSRTFSGINLINKQIKSKPIAYQETFSASLSYSRKNNDDSVTLSMSCSSDEIHDILLNNMPFSKNVNFPPFKNTFNLECYADDQPQLSDNIEDLFSIKREPEPKYETIAEHPLSDTPHQDDLSNRDELQTNAELPAANEIFEENQDEEEETDESYEPTLSSGQKRKLSLSNSVKSFSDDSSNESTVPNKKIKSENIYADEIEFSISFIKKNFTKDELKSGIFPDKNNKTRSKNKIPFDADKTENLKSELSKNFCVIPDEIDFLWQSIRAKLNHRITRWKKYD